MAMKFFQQSDLLMDAWHFVSDKSQRVIVLPDGCRDVVIRQTLSGDWSCHATQLDSCAYSVETVEGEAFTGFRFHPAVRIDEEGLMAHIRSKQWYDEEQIKVKLPEHVVLDDRLNEALTVLAESASVHMASRSIGVSERTLERIVQAGTLRSPVFWKSLARVRQSARSVTALSEIPLSQIAADHGYADQAHMTREFKRWFGVTPSSFRRYPEFAKTIKQLGYG